MAYGIWLVGLILLKVPWCVWPAGLFNPFIPCLCTVLLLKSVEHGTTIIIWHKVANFLIDWAFVHFSDQWFWDQSGHKGNWYFQHPKTGIRSVLAPRDGHNRCQQKLKKRCYWQSLDGCHAMAGISSNMEFCKQHQRLLTQCAPCGGKKMCTLVILYFSPVIYLWLFMYNLVLYIYTVYSLFMLFNMIARLINCATIW